MVTEQDMRDTFEVGFKAGVQQGNVSCLMCSYNSEALAGDKAWGYGVNGTGSAFDHGGIPSCANRYLMNDLARSQWGFRGYITSDVRSLFQQGNAAICIAAQNCECFQCIYCLLSLQVTAGCRVCGCSRDVAAGSHMGACGCSAGLCRMWAAAAAKNSHPVAHATAPLREPKATATPTRAQKQ
eukprot:SAG25_NODE_87_length_16363_cov_40.489179_13_plen_183_part_00